MRRRVDDFETEDLVEFQVFHCDLAANLEATTYFQEHEEHSVLALAEIRKHSFAVLKTTKFEAQKQKFCISDWKKARTVTC